MPPPEHISTLIPQLEESGTDHSDNRDPKIWKTRSIGSFGQNTRVRKVELDPHAELEHGELTWTTGQTVRDIFQNHLDANTQMFFDNMVSSIVDLSENGLTVINTDKHHQEIFDDFTYGLYVLKRCGKYFSEETKSEFYLQLSKMAKDLPINDDFLNVRGDLSDDKVDNLLSSIDEVLPEVSYRIIDSSDKNEARWITLDELQQPEYLEKATGSDDFRYQIVSCKIEDVGKGFDSKLTAFFMSTKSGKRHFRGKFGEGAKMSELHLLRNNAFLKMRAIYDLTQDSQTIDKERVWQVRPHLNENEEIRLKGVEIETDKGTSNWRGACTVINIRNAKEEFARESRQNIDPRIETGLFSNILDFNRNSYHYTVNLREEGKLSPVGISTTHNPSKLYVQGLNIEGADSYAFFSYDFLDSSLLKGRDRNKINIAFEKSIIDAWNHMDNPELLESLVTRVWLGNDISTTYSPEFKALRGLIDKSMYGDPQGYRAKQSLLGVIPKILNLQEDKKYLILSKYDYTKNEQLVDTLIKNDYEVLVLNQVTSINVDNLSRFYKDKFKIFSVDSARADIINSEGHIDNTDERAKYAIEIYNSAENRLNKLLQTLGANTDVNISDIHCLEASDPKTQKVIELEWDEEKSSFNLLIRPDMLKTNEDTHNGRDYWERLVMLYMISALNRYEPFKNKEDQMKYAQHISNYLLYKSIKKTDMDHASLPEKFDHAEITTFNETFLDRYFERFNDYESNIRAWDLFIKARSLSLSSTEFIQLYNNLDQFPPHYKKQIDKVLKYRIILEDNSITRVDRNPYGTVNGIDTTPLSELEVVGDWQGRNILRVTENTYIIPIEIPNGSIVTCGDNHEYVFYNYNILDFSHNFNIYNYWSYPITLDKNVITVSYSSGDTDSNQLERLYNDLQKIEIKAGNALVENIIKTPTRVIETSLPKEYGKDEWDNPIRVFQDILQNHLDAVSRPEEINLEFEIERDSKRYWVTQESVLKNDIIRGFRISDTGSGYPPNKIGSLGYSSKKSQLYAGKYGEGQNLIAAACARNDFELEYSSVSEYQDTPHQWTARVSTKPESIIIDGKPVETERVIFYQNSIPLDHEIKSKSSTTVRLPDNYNGRQLELWNEWLKTIDPRLKDQNGNSGLERYANGIRKYHGDNVIDMGYMKILLNEPGAIYENGLLITSSDESKIDTALGYDVPRIVDNRERNSYDKGELKKYIAHALFECRDPRLSMLIFRKLKSLYLDDNQNLIDIVDIKELDLNLGNTSYERELNLAQPLWIRANEEVLGSLYVHSEQALLQEIQYETGYAKEEKAPGYKTTHLVNLEKLRSALANAAHIPNANLLEVYSSAYKYWQAFLPTSEDYNENLNEISVEITPETKDALVSLVESSANEIRNTLNPLLVNRDDKLTTLISILRSQRPDEFVGRTEDAYGTLLSNKLNYWSDKTIFNENQDSVFVAPYNASYLGLATPQKIGFNESLLVNTDMAQLVNVSRHELVHKISNLLDYTVEFVMLLNLLAEERLNEN